MAKRKVEREERFAPTPETRAKLEPDVVASLHDAGHLHAEQLQAAREINRVWQALQRGSFGASQGSGGTGIPKDPMSKLTAAEETLWRQHFRHWAHEAYCHRVGSAAHPSNLKALTLDIAGDNIGLMAAAFRHFLRPDLVLPTLQGSLTRYAQIAGWV